MKRYSNIIDFANENFSDDFFIQICEDKDISVINLKFLIIIELQFCTHFEESHIREYAEVTLNRMQRETSLESKKREFTNHVLSVFVKEIIMQRVM